MERTRRARLLIMWAKDRIESRGDQPEAVEMLREAIELLRKIESDMARFRDLLNRTGEDLYRATLAKRAG